MPTPSGKPKAGDMVRHGDVLFRVVERTSNGDDYGLVLEACDGRSVPASMQRHGNPKQMLLVEAKYWLAAQGSKWRLVKPGEVDHALLVDQVHAANPDISRNRIDRIVQLTIALSKRR